MIEPSGIPNSYNPKTLDEFNAMSKSDIQKIKETFRNAAVTAKKLGFDGV